MDTYEQNALGVEEHSSCECLFAICIGTILTQVCYPNYPKVLVQMWEKRMMDELVKQLPRLPFFEGEGDRQN